MQEAAANTFRVVCLGGSAGAFSAYSEILRNLPANTGMAFVVVAHRALKQKEKRLLSQALSFVTSMPVVEVEHGMQLEPDRVFVMPPGVDMTISHNHLHLKPGSKPHGWPIALSVFLQSLADSVGPRAVAIILSGLDHDGSVAMGSIKAGGGITFAQSNPAHSDMPRHAIETGYVDFVMHPAEIAKTLLALAQNDLNRPT